MTYTVQFTHDPEADVWLATSDDIAGLVLEDPDRERLERRVHQAANDLLRRGELDPDAKLVFQREQLNQEVTNETTRT